MLLLLAQYTGVGWLGILRRLRVTFCRFANHGGFAEGQGVYTPQR